MKKYISMILLILGGYFIGYCTLPEVRIVEKEVEVVKYEQPKSEYRICSRDKGCYYATDYIDVRGNYVGQSKCLRFADENNKGHEFCFAVVYDTTTGEIINK